MRCRGQHDHCIGAVGQQFRQPCALRLVIAAFRNILRLIDHDDIPVGIFQMGTVFHIALQRIDGHNGLVIIEEGIIV